MSEISALIAKLTSVGCDPALASSVIAEAFTAGVTAAAHRRLVSRNGVDHNPVDNSDFERFWAAYPRRDGANPKAPAQKLFCGYVKSGIPAADIIAGAVRCALKDAAKIGTPYIPQAVKWLRDQRWLDYPPQEEIVTMNGYHAKAESPQYEAWQVFHRKTRPNWHMRDRDGGWWFPTEWPPDYPSENSTICPSQIHRVW